jgi:phytoene desaturase
MQNPGKRNTVVIIGAGVAGCTAGSYLARQGFQVKVLEASPKIGGCCGSTAVDGYIFTDGAQYLIYPRILDLVFSQLGFDRSEILPLRRATTPQTTHLPDGTTVTLGDNFQLSVENGKIDIARAQDELTKMVRRWEPVGKILEDQEVLLNPFSTIRLFSKAWKQLPKLARSLEGEFKALFSEPVFRSALAAHVLYAGTPLNRLPSVSIVALVSALTEGMTLPVGGMGKIPEALAHTLRTHGGEIFLDERVRNIRLGNGCVTGIQTERGDFIECDLVISTASAMTTYQSLLEPTAQTRRMIQKVEQTPLSAAAFSIQLGASNKLEAKSHLNYFVPLMEELDQYFSPVHDRADWGYYSIPTVIAPELAPAGCSVLEYFPVISQGEPVDAWSNDRVEQFSRACVAWLQDQFEINIAAKRVRSPREFRDQLNLYEGSVYGVSPAKGVAGLFPHRTPIQGLYLAGQTTYPGLGIPTAALSGIHAANEILKSRDNHS